MKLNVIINIMIVCLCRSVTDRAIRAAIDAGATTMEEVGQACRAGTGCGACRIVIEEMLDEAGVRPKELPGHPERLSLASAA
jgi:bacterioferritin-associated ferredoxin